MKIRSLIVLPLVALSFNFAFAQHDELTNRLYDRSDSVHATIRQYAHKLDEKSQVKILGHLRAIEDLVMHGDRPAPYPPQRPTLQSVRGNVESKSFSFEVVDLLDLHNQCVSFVAQEVSEGTSVDDINVSINFGASTKLRNGSTYWKGEALICAQIEKVAADQGLVYRGPGVTYTGTIEDVSFQFSAQSIAELGRQCDVFVNAKIGSSKSVDDITVSVNLGPAQTLKNRSTYWKGSFEICQQILQQR